MHLNFPVSSLQTLASRIKDLSLPERPALYQLVGEVTAHQGYDA